MAVSPKKKKKADKSGLVVNGIIVVVFLSGIGFVAHLLLSDTGPRRKDKIQVVKLLKPPPPPEQKPPEPEVPKEAPKQEIVEDVPQPQDTRQNDQPQDDTPAGQDLGVDAEGGAGSDGFGLVGKKGGRGITLGGGGSGASRMSLLAKYGWYTKKLEKELWRQVNQLLVKDGGIPKGKHQMTVHLELNARGDIVRFRVVALSGNDTVDKAVQSALPSLKVSEPPPEGMPRGMTLRIASQG
jgi:protein TonB